MNKQEAINKLKSKKILGPCLSNYAFGYNEALDEAISIVKQLDETLRPPEPKPLGIEKPVVPQYVADWYEENKDNFDFNLYKLCIKFYEKKLSAGLYAWFNENNNKCIETIVKMKLFGYEIEKEKLYTVEIPNPGCTDKGKFVLCKNKSGKVFMKWTCLDDWKFLEKFQLTEEEVKEKFDWAWQFAEEV